MRMLTNLFLMATLIIASALAVAPVLANQATGQVAFAGERDDAGDDDDNRGRGKDKNKDKKDKNEKKDNSGRGRGNNPGIGVTEAYSVDVSCEYDEDDNITECEFTGVAPDGTSDIGRVTVPADGVCAVVLGGDFVFVDSDSDVAAGVVGYATEDDDDELELELHGKVTTSGSMDYWISTIGTTFPAEGPALLCDQAQGVASDQNAVPTSPATPPASTPELTTDTLVVATYTCDAVPADTQAFDWFGQCEPNPDPLTFIVTPAGSDVDVIDGHTMETDATGEAIFDALDPGTYRLDAVDAAWCHATSDNVNSESEVVLHEGEQTTVWTFHCGDGKE